jgi:hypothetical protein
MRRKRRRWEESGEDDPGAGLLNLFDVWIAFAVALLLAMVSYFSLSTPPPPAGKSGDRPALEAIQDTWKKVARYRESQESVGGEGERLGTAYRLKSGEVIYVPDKGEKSRP